MARLLSKKLKGLKVLLVLSFVRMSPESSRNSPKSKKVELAEWNKSNPKKDGTTKKRKAGENNSKQFKAWNDLLIAMV